VATDVPGDLPHPVKHRLSVTRCKKKGVVTLQHRVGQRCRVGIGSDDAGSQRPFGQEQSHRLQHKGHCRWLAVVKPRACKAVGRDQDQPLHPVGMRGGKAPGQPPADRISRQRGAGHPQMVQDRQKQCNRSVVGIVFLRVGPRQPRTGQVIADDPVVDRQPFGPGIKGMQA
jgi:hypothetical protein